MIEKYNWEEIDASVAVRMAKEQTAANTLSGERSLHCWTEVFVVGNYAYKVEGTYSSDEIKVYYDKPLNVNDFTSAPFHHWIHHSDVMRSAWEQLIAEGKVVL